MQVLTMNLADCFRSMTESKPLLCKSSAQAPSGRYRTSNRQCSSDRQTQTSSLPAIKFMAIWCHKEMIFFASYHRAAS